RRHTGCARSILLKMVGAHYHTVANRRAALNDAANSDNTSLNVRVGNNAAVGNDRLPQSRAIDLAAGQKPRMGINWRFGVEKTVFRNKISQIEVRFIKRAHCPDVFPVTLKNK